MVTPTARPSVVRRAAPALAALALAGALPAALGAQAAVAGVVSDSLLGGPLAGALVQLVSASGRDTVARSAASDSAGRFRLEAVPPGRYLVGFFHPRLAEVGLQLPARQLVVAAGDTLLGIALAVPGARAVAGAVCGWGREARPDSSGMLLGRVLDADSRAPAAAGVVRVQWAELVIGQRGAREEERVLRAPVDDEGRYAACGVPTAFPVLVQATSRSDSSGLVELQVPPGSLLHRDLLVPGVDTAAVEGAPPAGPRRGTARLVGRVIRPDGGAARAQVLLRGSGAADTVAIAGPSGDFVLGALPAGTYTLEARAIGYRPTRQAVDLSNGRTATVRLTLGERVTTLERVRVVAAAPRRDLTGFGERSRWGFGRFITAEDIESRHPSVVSDVLRMVPGLHVEPSRLGTVVLARGRCRPAVFLDGIMAYEGASALDILVQPQDIAGIEVYVDVATVPPEFKRGNCGVVVVWTKRGRG